MAEKGDARLLLLIVPFLAAWPLGGAREAAGQDRSTDRGRAVVPLTGRQLTQPNLLMLPTAVSVIGGLLLVLDPMADSVAVLLDTSGAQLMRFGGKGAARGEFEAPVSIDAQYGSDGSFWVIDGALHRATAFSYRRGQGPGLSPQRVVPLVVEGGGPIAAAFADTEGGFVGTGLFQSKRFVRFLRRGAAPFGPSPPGSPDTPIQVRNHAFQSALAPHPDRSRFAAATRYADRLEIYALDGSVVAEARRLRNFDPVYETKARQGRPTFAPGLDLRYGYIAVAANRQSIFALYSGRNHLEAPGAAPYGAVVEELDWAGSRLRTFGLDRDAVAIAVDSSGQALYAVVHEPLPAIVRYALNSSGWKGHR